METLLMAPVQPAMTLITCPVELVHAMVFGTELAVEVIRTEYDVDEVPLQVSTTE